MAFDRAARAVAHIGEHRGRDHVTLDAAIAGGFDPVGKSEEGVGFGESGAPVMGR
jgi:hypothetical protein